MAESFKRKVKEMIKAFVDTHDGRKVLMLIITKGNIEHFLANHPLHISAEEMMLPEFYFNELLIVYFETEKQAMDYFIENELINESTKIINEGKPH